MINIPKGLKDVLPSESGKWQAIETVAREVCRLYNIREIRTPTFEYTELFLRGVGDTTDIVNKEMYTFLDKGGRSITLKPEGTAGVARSFIEKNLGELYSLPVKTYYFTPVFRYENPQSGRLREHHQFGVELFGSDSPIMDFEAIMVLRDFLDRVDARDYEVRLNSIGCNECRKEYNTALIKYFQSHQSEICKLCSERLERNPLRVLDCKNPACISLKHDAPKTINFLCVDCETHFNALQSMLKTAKVHFKLDTDIVRGLDYYTKTVFEFVSSKEGREGTLAGGGRYNALVEQLGGKPVPAVGFGLGLERLLINLLDSSADNDGVTLYLAVMSNEYLSYALSLADELRKLGISVDIDCMNRSLKAQLKYADKIRASNLIVIGENEMRENAFILKDMALGNSLTVSKEQLIKKLKNNI